MTPKSHAEFNRLIERMKDDANLRAQVKADPQGAPERAGFTLSEDERRMLTRIVSAASDTELLAQLSRPAGDW